VQVIGFERFRTLLAQELEIAEDALTREARFVLDLDFDSFQLFRLAIFVEMLAPVDIPAEIDIETLTVGAVYEHYAVEAALL
jgi:acyl carrier protein